MPYEKQQMLRIQGYMISSQVYRVDFVESFSHDLLNSLRIIAATAGKL